MLKKIKENKKRFYISRVTYCGGNHCSFGSNQYSDFQ